MIRSQAAYESVVIDILAVSGNSFILLGVLIILVFAVAYALFTIKGSGISRTPSAKGAGTAGAVGPRRKAEWIKVRARQLVLTSTAAVIPSMGRNSVPSTLAPTQFASDMPPSA